MASFTPEPNAPAPGNFDGPKMTVLMDRSIPGVPEDRSLQVVWHHVRRSLLVMVRSGGSRDPVARWDGTSFLFNHRTGWMPSAEVPGADGDPSALRLVTYSEIGCRTDPACGHAMAFSSDPVWAEVSESCPRLHEAAGVMFE